LSSCESQSLNGHDETTLAPLEIATDLAIFAETTEIAVLRACVEHPIAVRRAGGSGLYPRAGRPVCARIGETTIPYGEITARITYDDADHRAGLRRDPSLLDGYSSGADDSSRDELAIPPLKLLPPSLERGYTASTTIIREIPVGHPPVGEITASITYDDADHH